MANEMSFNNFTKESEDYDRIAKAIQFIETNFKSQPNLEEIAKSVFMSKFHFDRVFKRWAGISPIQFLQFITLDYTKKKLAQSYTILDTAYDAKGQAAASAKLRWFGAGIMA